MKRGDKVQLINKFERLELFEIYSIEDILSNGHVSIQGITFSLERFKLFFDLFQETEIK